MRNNLKERKSLNLMMPLEIWLFLKELGAARQTFMTSIIIDELYKLKSKYDKNKNKC